MMPDVDDGSGDYWGHWPGEDDVEPEALAERMGLTVEGVRDVDARSGGRFGRLACRFCGRPPLGLGRAEFREGSWRPDAGASFRDRRVALVADGELVPATVRVSPRARRLGRRY